MSTGQMGTSSNSVYQFRNNLVGPVHGAERLRSRELGMSACGPKLNNSVCPIETKESGLPHLSMRSAL